MWNEDEVKGKTEEVKGKAKQAAGDLTDDENLQAEGEAQEARRQGAERLRQGSPRSRQRHQGRRRRIKSGQGTGLSRLEQRHIDRGSRFNGVDVGGNLDISVRTRHAGDVARRLERRHRRPIFNSNRIELMPARCRRDAPAPAARVSVLLILGPSRAMRRSIGTSSMCAFDRHDVGIAWHRKHRLAVDDTETGGLAGFHRDAVKQQRASAPQSHRESNRARRQSSHQRRRRCRESTRASSVSRSASSVSGAGGCATGMPPFSETTAEMRETVDVVDLARLQFLSGLDDFIARRQESRRADARYTSTRRDADGGERADAARVECLARGDDDLSRLECLRRARRHSACGCTSAKIATSAPALESVSSTITTASAPSGIGAPVEISTHWPSSTGIAETSPV